MNYGTLIGDWTRGTRKSQSAPGHSSAHEPYGVVLANCIYYFTLIYAPSATANCYGTIKTSPTKTSAPWEFALDLAIFACFLLLLGGK